MINDCGKEKPLDDYQKEILAVMLDMGAIGDKKVPLKDVIAEVERRMAKRKALLNAVNVERSLRFENW